MPGPRLVQLLEDRTVPAAPTINLIGIDPVLTKSGPVVVSLQFSEPVVGFEAADLELVGTVGGKVALAGRGDDRTFDATIDGFSGQGFVTIRMAPDAVRATADGRPTAAYGPLTVATADTVPPTIDLSVPGVVRGTTVEIGVRFSEPISGFAAAAVKLGGTIPGAKVVAATTAADGRSGVVTVGGLDRPGTLSASVLANAVTDQVGFANPSASGTVTARYVPPNSRGFALGSGEGAAASFLQIDDTLAAAPAVVPFEAGFTGGVRVAAADVDGDGILDVIVGSGPGRVNEVRVYDGKTPGRLLFAASPFEPGFTGGVFVAGADVTGDGKADLVVSPDVSGGPRVRVLDGAAAVAGRAQTVADFFGIADPAFRGGARVAAGDVTGDGTPDVVVSAGAGGGPRVAGFDGRALAAGREARLFGDFFAYESTLRNGSYPAVGDLNADGFGDLVFGGGPGGGPRVRVLDGRVKTGSGGETALADYFAGDPANRGGVRVAAADLDGDGKIDLVTGPGETGGSRASVYYGRQFPASAPAAERTLDLFSGFFNGVFVG